VGVGAACSDPKAGGAVSAVTYKDVKRSGNHASGPVMSFGPGLPHAPAFGLPHALALFLGTLPRLGQIASNPAGVRDVTGGSRVP
jgi:hypothetical protein